ncbi:MAG TPA: GGDEF domain-containing protein [Thermoanaerobaculia bacterium]|nr:GGDEF domain-containing protein [Thermoanaerobaculia bacterium]
MSKTDQLEAAERVLRSLSEPDRNVMQAVLRDLEQRIADLSKENIELLVQNRVLAEVSARDSLTGLYNRWYVLEKIESEINRSLRHGSPMSLLMLDLDHFKNVNDTYGHVAGDHVLQVVARLLKESCRVYDVPGRYGGEEFCLLLPETTLKSTPMVAERIRHRLETTEMEVTGASVVVTASIGIAGIDNETADPVLSPGMLIDRADRALYVAKNQGRNRIMMWDSESGGAKPLGTEH